MYSYQGSARHLRHTSSVRTAHTYGNIGLYQRSPSINDLQFWVLSRGTTSIHGGNQEIAPASFYPWRTNNLNSFIYDSKPKNLQTDEKRRMQHLPTAAAVDPAFLAPPAFLDPAGVGPSPLAAAARQLGRGKGWVRDDIDSPTWLFARAGKEAARFARAGGDFTVPKRSMPSAQLRANLRLEAPLLPNSPKCQVVLPNCWRSFFVVLPKTRICQVIMPNCWSCSNS
jgi:hypothetical protein